MFANTYYKKMDFMNSFKLMTFNNLQNKMIWSMLNNYFKNSLKNIVQNNPLTVVKPFRPRGYASLN